MALGAGSPCAGPTSTSERIPRMVRVIGAQVTVVSTPMAASRVRMQTGRRPLGLAAVGVDQRLVGFGEFACLKDGDGAAPEELGSADAGFGGEGVQPADELVVELHEDF